MGGWRRRCARKTGCPPPGSDERAKGRAKSVIHFFKQRPDVRHRLVLDESQRQIASSAGAMSLDPHHVHNFWGVSPALDLRDVVRRCRADQATSEEGTPPDASDAPFSTLLVGTNDPRHIVTTLARARRHVGPALLAIWR